MASAKEYLKQIREEQVEIRALINRREEIRLSLYPKAITYDGIKVQTSPTDILSERTAKICELDDAITEQIERLDKRKAQAMKTNAQLEDSRCRQLISLYYLSTRADGKPLKWSEVANVMGYSEKHVIREIHPRALREFAKQMEVTA